ncbi:MAG: efflux RND transporter permease subunit [Melioribacteraceae bacterium]|nr:efflux RND transporter permease subunit [Melioribacteraceae bacterium]
MNNLPKFSINNYQFVLIVFVVTLIWGMNSFLTMPRTEDPPAAQPGAIVTVIYPGASPSDMEELIINPIEEEVNGLELISEIKSSAGNGYAFINVSFDYGNYNFDDKYDDVVQAVNEVKTELPSGIGDINFRKKTTTDTKILQLALSSETVEFSDMRIWAESLEKKLEQVKGIKTVDIIALPEQQVKILMQPDKMVNMGIGVSDIENGIKANNQNIPGGELVMGENSFNIKTSGSYESLDEIRNTVVGSVEGQLVYLKDIADVEIDYEENNYLAGFNGTRSIFLTAEQKSGTNVLAIVDEAKVIIDDFEASMPENIHIHYVHNQAENVEKSVNGFLNNLFQGIVLVGFAIMLAIGFKSSLVIMLAIPSSILIGLGFVDLAGFGLQSVSIAALVIALGLLVDNSIVVIENTERYLKQGMSSKEAAIKGTKQVAYPIISSTLTTLAAFIPIAMLSDAAGDFIQSMPVTVVATLTASVVLALSVSPLLMAILFKRKKETQHSENWLQKKLASFISGPYRKILHFSLTNTKTVLLASFVLFLSAVMVFKFFVGSSFFPKAEKPLLMVQATLPQNKTIKETEKVAHYIESVLDTIPEIKQYASNVGNGNPKVHFNLFPKDNAKNFTEFFVELKEYDLKAFEQFVSRLRNTFSDYSKAEIVIKEFQSGQVIQYPVQIILNGDNIENLMKAADDVEAIMKNHPGIINVENELDGMRTDLHVIINKDKASMLGVAVSAIDKTIRTAMNGTTVSKFNALDGKEYDIQLSLPLDGKAKIEDFDKIFIKSMLGKQIPLSQLARVEFVKNPNKITHYNLSRSATVGSDVASGYNTAKVTKQIEAQIKAYKMPLGVSYIVAGESAKQNKSFGGLGAAAVIAMLIIFAILVLQFHSFMQPFIIFTSIPFALTGSFYALFLSGFDFSFTAFIGAIALIGIAVNDAIVFIDFANEERKQGKNIYEALMETGKLRFVPILITSVTTIGGLLPLTLGGGLFWGPLGWTIIGGLSLSTLLTLVIVPVLYKVMIKEKSLIK